MKNITLILLVLACGIFLSLENSPFISSKQKSTLKIKESRPSSTKTSKQKAGTNVLRIDSSIGLLMIQAYINSPTPSSGIDLTKSVYFNYKILSQEIDTLKAHSIQNGYIADSLGFRIHFAKYDGNNNAIRAYLVSNNILDLSGRNTVLLQVTHKGKPAYDLNGQSIYMNMGDLCPRNCPD
ncbi:MAG TPA: hypothetical protein VK590_07330 [Saprospiraceae bacterium]|nr:hypothetical protein [Saprospiraceae bacterium]